MRRFLPWSCLFALLMAPAAGAWVPEVSDAPFAYLPPGPVELERVKEAFRDAAARSASDRSGQIFALPQKYDLVIERDGLRPNFAHFRGQRKDTLGTAHGNSWEYDTRIPLVLWGPGMVRRGFHAELPATQQDLVPTYALLMGATPPDDAFGRVLSEALVPRPRHPKVILTVVFDQAGEVYYRAHPGATPRVDQLKREGASYDALVSHVDCETGIGHAAIGTGAWPGLTGISSNNLWIKGLGGKRYSFHGESEGSPIFLGSPTLGDVWLRQTHNQALVAGYCYADRAAIGMAGHGSLYQGNKKPWVIFYDDKAGTLTTNEAFYAIPDYLKGRGPGPQLEALTHGTMTWMDHPIDPKDDVRATPAYVTFDGDNAVDLIQRETWGADEITDLLYVTLKSTDTAGHAYGHESDEAGAVLAEQDKQLGRMIDALIAKVGADNLLVTLTADHGSTPLPELSGGVRLVQDQLVDALNRKFDSLDNGVRVVEYATATQIFINEAERVRNGVSYDDLKRALMDYKVDGKPFFVDVLTRDEALARARKFARP